MVVPKYRITEYAIHPTLCSTQRTHDYQYLAQQRSVLTTRSPL
jgi:hypothetical protein